MITSKIILPVNGLKLPFDSQNITNEKIIENTLAKIDSYNFQITNYRQLRELVSDLAVNPIVKSTSNCKEECPQNPIYENY